MAFAAAVREEVERRKSALRVFSFQDQLDRLESALEDPKTERWHGRSSPQGSRWCWWTGSRTRPGPVEHPAVGVRSGSGATLVLIGDPKQAIYRFRGADVHAYTSAVHEADSATTLTVNHRSDKPVVDAVGALFDGVKLGDSIEVPKVDAANVRPRLVSSGEPWSAGLQIRCIDSAGQSNPWRNTTRIAADLVGVVGTLLSADAPLRHQDGPLAPEDIAILVRSNWNGRSLANDLRRAGIPASFAGADSVLDSEAASEWLTLMRALDQPRRPHLQRAIITRFLGGTVAGLAAATDDDWAEWTLRIRTWSRVLSTSGVPALSAAIERDADLTPRLLGQPNGERLATDYAHVAELLHRWLKDRGNRPRDAVTWLEQAISQASSEEATRRLETDSGAVQIMTVHRAKGRQFPVVLVPDAIRSPERTKDSGNTLDLPIPGGRLLDVGGSNHPERAGHLELASTEDADESLRVCGTLRHPRPVPRDHLRAEHPDTERSPLHRLLSMPREGAQASSPHLPGPLAARTRLAARPPDSGGQGQEGSTGTHGSTPPGPQALRTRDWTRTIDQTWRRTSYTGLTAGTHDESPGGDEPRSRPRRHQIRASPRSRRWRRFRRHHLRKPGPPVMERIDPRGPDWMDALRAECATALGRWPIPTSPRPTWRSRWLRPSRPRLGHWPRAPPCVTSAPETG